MRPCATMVVTAVLLASLYEPHDARSPARTATAASGGVPAAWPFPSAAAARKRTSFADGSPALNDYDSDGVGGRDDGDGGDGDDDGDDVDREHREREDQLDQDDPVSTVTVTAVRGSIAWLPCDIGGGNNDGLPTQSQKVVSTGGDGEKSKDTTNTPEDRAYMVLWFKHQPRPTVRHRNNKSKYKKMSSGGKPLYSFDVRGRPLAHALKWSSDETSGGFGPRASFVVFGSGVVNSGAGGGGRGIRPKQHLSLDDYVGMSDNSSRAALRVANVTEQDAGAYRCRVDFRDSPTRNYRIILRVIVPPDKMTIVYNGGTEIDYGMHHVIGPVPEGGQLVLVCRVLGGKPKPLVQWYSADGKVTQSLNIEIVDLAEGQSFGNNNENGEITTKKLVINQLNRSHANSTYTCVAGNDDNAIESNLRMTILINMYLNVKSVRIVDVRPVDDSDNTVNYNEYSNNNGYLQQATNLISGKWYTVECWAEGASPKATIEWSIDGNGTLVDEIPTLPTTARIRVIEQTEHSSRIQLRPTPSDDGRYLRCRAWNPDINTTKDNVKNKALLLNVQYPPIVKLSLGHTFDPSRIKTGDDVYFECKVLDGGGGKRKQRNHIEWYHNGHPILQNGSNNGSISINSDIKVVLLSAGTLVIRNVGRRHSGRYTCQCSNDLGIGRSRPVTLRVQYAPVCADDGSQLQLVGVEKHEDNVHVLCRVRADPADDRVQFEWLVWPGGTATAAELHQQQSPSVVATGNYVTTALSGPRNDTAAGTVVGELVLPATTVGFPDAAQYADRAPSFRKPVVLDTVSCRATNAVGLQQHPCVYHIIPASPPGPLMTCVIRLPKDQGHIGNDNRHPHQHHHHQHHHQRSVAPKHSSAEDTAIISCDLGNDGGIRPLTYSLEIYESNVKTTISSAGSTEETIDDHRNKYRNNEWLVDNVTGTAVSDGVEYHVNRKNLQLRIGPGESQKYLSLSAYAGNRIGRGPQTYFSSGNPWWWHGESTKESSTSKTGTGPAGTSSTEWWIMLSGNDDRHGKTANGGGNATSTIVMALIAATVMVIAVTLVLLWKRKWRGGNGGGGGGTGSGGSGGRQLSATCTETTIAVNSAAANNRDADCAGKANRKTYSLLSQQQQRNVYPNLSPPDDRGGGCSANTAESAPDIMIQQNYGKQCLVSIANCRIPGPESCV